MFWFPSQYQTQFHLQTCSFLWKTHFTFIFIKGENKEGARVLDMKNKPKKEWVCVLAFILEIGCSNKGSFNYKMQFWFDITLLIWLTLKKSMAAGVITARIHSNMGTNATCFSKVTSKRFIMGLPLQFQWQHFTSDRKSIRINHITVASAELLGRND